MIHVDQARRRLVGGDPGTIDVPGGGVAHGISAAADAELAADGRQREHRHRGVAAVAVSFQTPTAADQCRRAGGVQLRGALEGAGIDAGNGGRFGNRPRLGALAQLLGTVGVVAQECLIGEAVREQIPVNGQRDGHVGARLDREVDVGRARHRG